MRLSDVLSKTPSKEYKQVEGFLCGKQCKVGQQMVLDVGSIALNYYCERCEDTRTFLSCGMLIHS